MSDERAYQLADRVRRHDAVGVAEHEDRSGRALDPDRQSPLLPDGLGERDDAEATVALLELAEQYRGGIGRAVVDDDHLVARVVGGKQRVDASLDHVLLVLDRHEAGDERRHIVDLGVKAGVLVVIEGEIYDDHTRADDGGAVRAEEGIVDEAVQANAKQDRERRHEQECQHPPTMARMGPGVGGRDCDRVCAELLHCLLHLGVRRR